MNVTGVTGLQHTSRDKIKLGWSYILNSTIPFTPAIQGNDPTIMALRGRKTIF